MKRLGIPRLSPAGDQVLEQYRVYLRDQQDLAPMTMRNYLSDVGQFLAWCEVTWAADGAAAPPAFTLVRVTTPILTRYRAHLQMELQLRPATINRYLISLKRFFGWALAVGQLAHDPTRVVKPIPETARTPRHLTDQEEDALVAAVTAAGNLRDRTIILLMLHTGLRAGEVCRLRPQQVQLQKRSGTLAVWGKRNKYREVPLNSSARKALGEYLPRLPPNAAYLFLSARTASALTERALGYLIAKYAQLARVADLSPHDLRHRFGYRMAGLVPLHRLAQIMGHDSLETTLLYIQGTPQDLQTEVEKIAWT